MGSDPTRGDPGTSKTIVNAPPESCATGTMSTTCRCSGIGRTPKWVQAILDERGIDVPAFKSSPMYRIHGTE